MRTIEEIRTYHAEYMRKYRKPGFVARVAKGPDKQKERARTEKYRKSEKGKATKKLWKSTPEQREKARLKAHLLRGAPPPTRVIPAHCECCGRPPNGRGLFHCHETNKFRGWLCFRCNSGIGNLGDDIAGVKRALAYLERAYGTEL